MNRKDIYSYIKRNNLQDKIKTTFGDNFTRISNKNLEEFIKKETNKFSHNKKNVVKHHFANVETNVTKKVNTPKTDKDFTFVSQMNAVKDVSTDTILVRLIEVLSKKHILLESEIKYVYNK